MTDAPPEIATQDPAEIERDIRRTQDEMSRTVDRIGNQFTPRNLINSLLDKAEDSNIDARYLLDGARRNPIALALIAGGTIWLASDSDAKLPKFGSGQSDKDKSAPARVPASKHDDPHHRDYIAHMDRVEWRDGEDDAGYQRRRDIARSNYFMLERGREEEEHTFRQRLNDATDKFREKRTAFTDSARGAGNTVYDGGTAAVGKAKDAYASNPLIGGLIAGAVGAIFGTALPLTRMEEKQLSDLGETARDMIGEQKDNLVSAAREKKDELISQVQEAAKPAENPATGQANASIPAYSATSTNA